MKISLVLFLLPFLLFACARTSPVPPIDEQAASQAWDRMLAQNPANSPYRIQFSLRFGEEGNTRRVTGILWGNSDDFLRLDIMAGVGAILAKMEDSPQNFLLYLPREHKSYFHKGKEKPLLKVGMPLPFNMPQLANLLNGHYGQVFGQQAEDGQIAGEDFKFTLANSPGGFLTINKSGQPIHWKQKGNGWQLSVNYASDQLPEQLKLVNSDGKMAIIAIKDRETPDKPFDKQQLDLKIPQNTPRLPLSDYKPM